MARSLYKGERLGKRPPCLICGGRGEGERKVLHLTHGVSVWLCAAHRDTDFLRRRSGRDFAATLMHLWNAAGCMTQQRDRALDAHLRNVRPTSPPRPRPGSYAWPGIRREAERRFAAGAAPAEVINDIRSRLLARRARPPSDRTMRRWFSERRWLHDDAEELRRPRRTGRAPRRPAPVG